MSNEQRSLSSEWNYAAKMVLMSTAYHQLLDGIIQHLEELKERGVESVPVSTETLAGLWQRPPVTLAARPVDEVAPANRPSVALSHATASSVEMASQSAGADRRPARPTVTAQPLSQALPGETTTPVSSPALRPEATVAAFADLRQRVRACAKCPNLVAARRNVVFGVGDVSAQLMFIGEAPGADEDAQGEPFVGRAGELLTKIIKAMGLTRDAVYIGNILKCRPDTPGQTSGNRKPTPAEMQTCIPFLHEQIDLTRPKVIVALGATAVEGLLGKTIGITRLRGQWRSYRGIPLMPTYHPAYLLRNQAPSEKRKVWEDMLQVMERLGLPISAKQRGFFLKG